MSEDGKRDPAAQPGGTAVGGMLAQMVRDLGETVSREIEQLRTEAGERAAGGVKGVQLLAGGAQRALSAWSRSAHFRSSRCAG